MPRTAPISPPIQFGLIGCDRISSQHFGAIAHFRDDLAFFPTCNIHTDRVRTAAKQYVGTPYTDHRKLLARPNIDVVTTRNLNAPHTPMVIAVARFDGVETRKPIEIVRAICQSARAKRKVRLPLTTQS